MHPSGDQFVALFAPAAALAVWQFIRADIARPTVVHHEAALEGAKLLKDWCTWLATIATGTVGLADSFRSRAMGKVSAQRTAHLVSWQ